MPFYVVTSKAPILAERASTSALIQSGGRIEHAPPSSVNTPCISMLNSTLAPCAPIIVGENLKDASGKNT